MKHNKDDISLFEKNSVTASAVPIEDVPLRSEVLRWLLSLTGSLLVYWLVATIVVQVYHPDIDALKKAAEEIFFETYTVRPEPVEALLFRLGIVIIIPSLLGFYALLSKRKFIAKLAAGPVYPLLSLVVPLSLCWLIFSDFVALNPFGADSGEIAQNNRDAVGNTNFAFYFDGIFTGQYLWVYLLIIVPLLACLFFIGFKKYKWEENKVFRIVSSVIGYGVLAWALLAIILMNVYDFPYTSENKYDFSSVYQSMTQVYAGLPMLVNGFTNTYGLYPHFLNPIFQITGLSVFTFSLVLSLLLGICFALNFYLLRQFVRNKIILFLGFATVMFFPYLDFMLLTIFDSMFCLFPVRYIAPSVLLVLTAFYLHRRSRLAYWITFTVAACSVLWNPEIGLVSFLSWLCVNIYSDFYNVEGKIDLKQITTHILSAIAVIIGTFYTYKLIIYLFYGAWVDFPLLFGTMRYFGKFGLGNLPMALIHPWNLTALILLCGFIYSLVKLYKKQVTVKASVILMLSLIGLGYFFYFQGRSQNSNFAFSTSFCLMLLVLLGDELWTIVSEKSSQLLQSLFVIFLVLISFSFVEIVFNSGKLYELISQDYNKDKQLPEQRRFDENKEYILKNTKPGQKILVFALKKRQALFFGAGKRICGFNPGFIEMFLASDLKRLEYTVRDSGFTVFMEPRQGNYAFLARPLAAFGASYEFSSYNELIGLFEKRQVRVPDRTFFSDREAALVHRKYTDDTAGKNMRIDDAVIGLKPIDLHPEFSVEILMHAKFQVFENAVVLSNLKDSSGFVIGNVINTPKYYFGVGSTGLTAKLPYNEWSYCVMNVFPDHCDVYHNGNLILTNPLAHPVRNSPGKLFVGNQNGVHYFAGAIAEVSVANKAVDTARIRQTWQNISREIIAK